MFPKIGIIGCGWLGKALANHLKQWNYRVKVTTRTQDKLNKLVSENFDCCLFSTTEGIEVFNPVFEQDIIIIAITPGFKRGLTDYAENIAKIVQCAEANQVTKIILVSSTGVYQGLEGDVDEGTVLNRTQHKAKILSEVINFKQQGKVLRLSGLVAEDRKPGRFLAGKSDLAGANVAINLIHRTDCVGLLMALIEQETTEAVFIGVSNTTATKAEFYSKAAKSLGLMAPHFDLSKMNEGKRKVIGAQTRLWLNYHYKHDDLLDWLDDN